MCLEYRPSVESFTCLCWFTFSSRQKLRTTFSCFLTSQDRFSFNLHFIFSFHFWVHSLSFNYLLEDFILVLFPFHLRNNEQGMWIFMLNFSLSIRIKNIWMYFFICIFDLCLVLLLVLFFVCFLFFLNISLLLYIVELPSLSISSSAASWWIGVSLLIQLKEGRKRGFVLGGSMELCWLKASMT